MNFIDFLPRLENEQENWLTAGYNKYQINY